jgi:hypothetical protein
MKERQAVKFADIKSGGLFLEEVHEKHSCSANVKCFHNLEAD